METVLISSICNKCWGVGREIVHLECSHCILIRWIRVWHVKAAVARCEARLLARIILCLASWTLRASAGTPCWSNSCWESNGTLHVAITYKSEMVLHATSSTWILSLEAFSLFEGTIWMLLRLSNRLDFYSAMQNNLLTLQKHFILQVLLQIHPWRILVGDYKLDWICIHLLLIRWLTNGDACMQCSSCLCARSPHGRKKGCTSHTTGLNQKKHMKSGLNQKKHMKSGPNRNALETAVLF